MKGLNQPTAINAPRVEDDGDGEGEDVLDLELLTLGVAGGPAIRGEEAGISSALLVGGSFYVIDFGLGMTRQARRAGLHGRNIRAGFITHMHSDHIIELPSYFLWNWGQAVSGFVEPFDIVGPGPDPQHSMLAGTHGLVDSVFEGFSYDIMIRELDESRPPLRELVRSHEIDLPAPGDGGGNRPFVVYRDSLVTVRAVLVDHSPVYPAFAYRFDTSAGSVTFSGDTAETPRLAELARDTDLLVHEAVHLDYYRSQEFAPEFIRHQEQSHTTAEGAGRIATAAGAKSLVLSHFAGVADSNEWRNRAAQTYSGPIVVATSGQRLRVGQGALR